MTYNKYVPLDFVYEYDFAVSGGAVSTISLVAIPTPNIMEAGMIVEKVTVYMDTAFTSSGAPTIKLGNSVDDDGYFVDFYALGTLANSFQTGKVAGALVWDDTNDVNLNYLIPSLAGAIPKIVIGTAAITAGKMKVVFQVRVF